MTFLLFCCPVAAIAAFVAAVAWCVAATIRIRKGNAIPRTIPRLFAIFLGVAISTYLWPTRPFLLRGKQVRTFANMQSVRGYLEAEFEKTGAYPKTLGVAIPSKDEVLLTDAWRSSLVYESNGREYLLISLGKDGERDESDYTNLRLAATKNQSVAGRWEADQVASDLGWHRQGGK